MNFVQQISISSLRDFQFNTTGKVCGHSITIKVDLFEME
jgi:hypothetical protein